MSSNVNNNSNVAAAAAGVVPIANAAQAPPPAPPAISLDPGNMLGLSLGPVASPPPFVWHPALRVAEVDELPLEKLSCSRKRDLGPIQGWAQSTYVHQGPLPETLPMPWGVCVAGPNGDYTVLAPNEVTPHSGAHASTSGAGSF